MDKVFEGQSQPAPDGAAAKPAAGPDARDFAVLDLVRAIAALAVVWNHAWNLVAGPMPADAGLLLHAIYISAGFGLDAVFAFFVVSGFWIGKSVTARFAGNRWSWSDYLVDRMSRLLVVLVPALALGALLDGIGVYLLDLPVYRNLHVVGPSGFDVASTLNLPTLLGNLAFLQGIVCPPFGSNVVLWSLSYEFWFYIWLPTLLTLARRQRIGVIAALVLVGSAVWLRPFLYAFPIWLIGYLAFRYWYGPGRGHAPDERRHGPLALGAATLVWLACLAVSHLGNAGFLATGWLTGLGAVPLVAIAGRLRWPGLEQIRWLARFGAGASYSLYAMHFPLLVLVVGLLPRALRNPDAAAFIAPALLVLCVAAAWLFAQLTEAQTPRFRRWLRGRVSPPRGALPA